MSNFRLLVAGAMPVAACELSAPLPWKPALWLAVSADFKAHDHDSQRFLKKRASALAHQNFGG